MNHKIGMPQLRFPSFDSQWESKKVGELCDSIVPGRNKPTNFEGDIPWITTPDIEHNGIINHSKKGLNISREEAKKVGSKIVPINSIIISCVGELGLSAIAGKEIIINQQLHAFIPKERIEYRFLLYQLNLKQKYMDKVATKTAVPYMNKDNCNSIPIDFPTLPEQQKIAAFLSAVDEKIQQLSRKKELLEQYKKGVMQQLFSGKLRFKDENGNDYADWEEKKLGDLGVFKGGGTPSTEISEYWDGDIPWISSSDLIENDISNINVTRFITEKAISESATKLIPVNSVLFISRVGVGKLAVSKRTMCTSQDFANFIPNEIDSFYLAYYFMKNNNLLSSYAQGTSIKGFTSGDLKSIKVSYPVLEEQQKIANFLSSIDTKIESTNKQINQTQTFKKGLLQQMFV